MRAHGVGIQSQFSAYYVQECIRKLERTKWSVMSTILFSFSFISPKVFLLFRQNLKLATFPA
jgi:hypothetical protein